MRDTNVKALIDLAGGIGTRVVAKLYPHLLEGTTGELVGNKSKETTVNESKCKCVKLK